MRRLLLIAAAGLCLGCNSPSTPLIEVDTVVHDRRRPHLFELTIFNPGSDAQIDRVDAELIAKNLVHSGPVVPDLGLPDQFTILDEPATLRARRETMIQADLTWKNAPPDQLGLAVVTAVFTASHAGEQLLRTEPLTFVMESQPGALDHALQSRPPDRDQPAELLDVLSTIEGRKSKGFEALLAALKAQAGSLPPSE